MIDQYEVTAADFPSVDAVTEALLSVQTEADWDLIRSEATEDWEEPHIDVRLRVQASGWSLLWGDSSYDLDHRGYWGASIVGDLDDPETLQETADDLLEQALEHWAQNGGDCE